MLQDVMRGRRTEVDYLNGYVANEGRRLGVPAPLNAAGVEGFRALGATVQPDPGHLAPADHAGVGGGVPRAGGPGQPRPGASRAAVPAHSRRSSGGMKIAQIETLHADGGWRNFAFAKLTTDTGVGGWSAYSGPCGGPGGVAGVIEQRAPALLGKDARAFEAQVALMYALRRQATGGV